MIPLALCAPDLLRWGCLGWFEGTLFFRGITARVPLKEERTACWRRARSAAASLSSIVFESVSKLSPPGIGVLCCHTWVNHILIYAAGWCPTSDVVKRPDNVSSGDLTKALMELYLMEEP